MTAKAKVFVSYWKLREEKGKASRSLPAYSIILTTMEEIARILKQHCGAGGTVKQGKIEIQGDQRERVKEKLRELGYVPKE